MHLIFVHCTIIRRKIAVKPSRTENYDDFVEKKKTKIAQKERIRVAHTSNFFRFFFMELAPYCKIPVGWVLLLFFVKINIFHRGPDDEEGSGDDEFHV